MVYFIRCGGTKYYKIGYTGSLESRLYAIQTSLPQQLILIAAFQSDHAKDIEQLLHSKYENNRVRGEWFKFNKKEADFIESGFKANGNLFPIHFQK